MTEVCILYGDTHRALQQRHQVSAQLRHVGAHGAARLEAGRHGEAARAVGTHGRADVARLGALGEYWHAAGHRFVQHLREKNI